VALRLKGWAVLLREGIEEKIPKVPTLRFPASVRRIVAENGS
jgi:hypothetical protein